jgi:hypothetical protein
LNMHIQCHGKIGVYGTQCAALVPYPHTYCRECIRADVERRTESRERSLSECSVHDGGAHVWVVGPRIEVECPEYFERHNVAPSGMVDMTCLFCLIPVVVRESQVAGVKKRRLPCVSCGKPSSAHHLFCGKCRDKAAVG